MEYKIKIDRGKKNILNDPWVWRMAFRDARNNPMRLLLFISSVIIGIAALVSINSFNINLQRSIDSQARELLGADFVLDGNKRFEPEIYSTIDSIPVEMAGESSLASMVQFMTSTSGVRLVRVVALEGDFPFYGELETLPGNAYDLMKSGQYAMMDANLMSQYDVSGDDSIKVGKLIFKVAGEVSKIPGGGGISSTFTPSVYISAKYLDSTGLVQYGSRVDYKLFFKVQNEEQVESAVSVLQPIAIKYGHSVDTVKDRKNSLGEGFKNMYRFFNLLAFVALILGCIGVASSVHIYVKEKKESVAVLRCVGASGWQSFNIFFIQAVVTGFIGSLLGVVLGVAIQYLIPSLLQEFIPLDLDMQLAWSAIGEGLLLGVLIGILFSALPLLAVRFIPPLAVLRSGFEPLKNFSKSRVFVSILIILFPLLFAAYQSESLEIGVFFFLGILLAFAALSGVGWLIMYLVRRFFPSNWGFIWKQSLANLYRPNNQTLVLVVVIGLGAFLIATLTIAQSSLLNQVEFVGDKNQSNTILFDIQPSQKEEVIQLTKENDLEPKQVVPIVTCRISEINGKTISDIQNDT
ncbi:MAG: FtsX-like permease family protein, partial [Fulvivirga sp.]|uniref:ABC transporter permease n=1 Tax=Fulvivirga sp. TaxID=1931237 RepID=UPI0032F0378C